MNDNIKIGCIVMLLGLMSACGGGNAADPKVADQAKAANNASAPMIPPGECKTQTISGIGRVEPEGQIIPLASNDAGIVTKVYVKEGDLVKIGDPLLELDHRILDAQIEQARTRLTTQASRIRTDEKSLVDAQLRLANIRSNVGRTEKLVLGGAEIGQNLSDQRSEMAIQENAIQRWQSVIDADRAQLRELEGDVAVLGQQLEYKVVRALMNGRLLTIRALLGSFVSSQAPFADFAPEGRTIVRCEIDEMYAGEVQLQQAATITEMGTGDALAKGHVIYTADFLKRKSLFSELAGEMEDRRVREVRIVVDGGDPLLFNSRVECRICTMTSSTDNH